MTPEELEIIKSNRKKYPRTQEENKALYRKYRAKFEALSEEEKAEVRRKHCEAVKEYYKRKGIKKTYSRENYLKNREKILKRSKEKRDLAKQKLLESEE